MTNLHELILSVKKKNKNNKINKNKRVKFCPVILTKKKTNRNKQKGQLVYSDIRWYVVPALPTLLPLPNDYEQSQIISYPNTRAGQNWPSENWAQVYSLYMVDPILIFKHLPQSSKQ